MDYSVDRLEDGLVVLIDSAGLELCVGAEDFDCLPREGMIVCVRDGRYCCCDNAEERKREDANRLLENLLGREHKN